MKPEDFKQTEESFQRYKENLTSLSQEFELALFLYLINKMTKDSSNINFETKTGKIFYDY